MPKVIIDGVEYVPKVKRKPRDDAPIQPTRLYVSMVAPASNDLDGFNNLEFTEPEIRLEECPLLQPGEVTFKMGDSFRNFNLLKGDNASFKLELPQNRGSYYFTGTVKSVSMWKCSAELITSQPFYAADDKT